jgi:tRNA-specific 2-thiouridylase
LREKILVALSGGVDSAVAAALAQESGYDVTGIIMTIYDGPESPNEKCHKHGCYGPGEEEDVKDAEAIAQHLGIKLQVFDLKNEYRTNILESFKNEYRAGRTPNPCVYCNQQIKLGALLDKARESGLDFEFVFTGHYARTDFHHQSNRYRLLRARYHNKDQSYFLSRLSQAQLRILRFPLGDLSKDEVRKLAERLNLPVSRKEESQNFISGGYRQLVCSQDTSGPIKNKSGDIIGQHSGISSFTIGQRHGLGLSSPEPLYVVQIDAPENTIVVGARSALYRDEIQVEKLNWISISQLENPVQLTARVRSAAVPAAAMVIPNHLTDSVTVRFEVPQMAPAPGQIAVFYEDDIVVGSGVITN